MQRASRWLGDGGLFALWTNVGRSDAFTARLRSLFADVEAEDVVFDNPLLEESETNALYFARG